LSGYVCAAAPFPFVRMEGRWPKSEKPHRYSVADAAVISRGWSRGPTIAGLHRAAAVLVVSLLCSSSFGWEGR